MNKVSEIQTQIKLPDSSTMEFHHQKSLYFVAFTILNFLYLLFFSGLFLLFQLHSCALTVTVAGSFSFLYLLVFFKNKELPLSFHIFISLHFFGIMLTTWMTGGINSPVFYWLSIAPVIGFMFINQKSGMFWLFVLIVTFLLTYFLSAEISGFLPQYVIPANSLLQYLIYFGLAIYAIILIVIKEQDIAQKQNILSQAQDKIKQENEFLRGQVEVINKRNFRLVKLYQNLEKFEIENNEKKEILEEATKLLDLKNKQIQRNRDILVEQSKKVEEINQNLTSSIKYASRIQEAMTPNIVYVQSCLKDTFIFYKPKDIVSGDFYWFADKAGGNEDLKILIAADCTGHGVPGAFMTVLGNTLLNEIVHTKRINSPDEILEDLDRKIIQTLINEKTDVQIHDGMDMAVVSINEKTKEIKFSAAHNPLYYVRKQELIEVKGSRFPVGSSQYKERKKYALHTIQAEEGDIFYLFSDGFQDQFGETEQRKYMPRRFRNFLLSINRLPIALQEQKLDAEHLSWRGSLPQTDDLLVIGFRL